MHLDILAAVLVTATIQSLFGMGVLLFGTPILLVLGYDFVTTLAVLLPISLSINLVQVGRHIGDVDREFYRKILTLTVPCVILFLVLVTKAALNIGIVVGLFLVLVALKSVAAPVNHVIEAMVRYERLYFLTMGIVHGLTNLGGSLLSAIVHSKAYDKDVARATTAASYGTFALVQLLTLAVSLDRWPIPAGTAAAYVMGGLVMFAVTDTMVYAKLGTERYRAIFAMFLFASGLVLILKSFLVP